jgi:hypothetical protein
MVSTTDNQSITPDARRVVEELNRFVTRPDVLAALRQAKAEGEKKLLRDPDLATAFVAFDPAQLGWKASDVIGSARVFVARDGRGDDVERHSNSTQYLFALYGPVETHVQTKDGWRVDRYGQGDSAELEDRWHVVPPATWHRSVGPGGRNWGVVAFHSAREVSDEYQ